MDSLPLWCHSFPELVSVKWSKLSIKLARKGLKCVCPGILLLCLSLFFPLPFTALVASLARDYNNQTCPDSPVCAPHIFNYLFSYCCTFKPAPFPASLTQPNKQAALTWEHILIEGIPPGWTNPHLAQSLPSHVFAHPPELEEHE